MKKLAVTLLIAGILLLTIANAFAAPAETKEKPEAAKPEVTGRVNPVQSLFNAIKDKDVKKVEALLKGDATLVTAKNENGILPLHRAALVGNTMIVKLLIEKGADVNATDDRFGDTPLHKAAWAGNLGVVKELVAHKAKLDVFNAAKKTPLMLAESRKKTDVVNYIYSVVGKKAEVKKEEMKKEEVKKEETKKAEPAKKTEKK